MLHEQLTTKIISFMKIMSKTLLVLFLFLGLVACDKDDPTIVDPVELITTLNYTLTSTTGEIVSFSFKDLDGDGGDAPVVSTGTLKQGTSYAGNIVLLDETQDPAENISEEVAEEDDEHQFFFQSTVDGLTVDYSDTDDDGNPIGLSSSLTTGDAGSGSLTIILRHQPNKSASGVSDGNITNAGGESDIEVSFDITVE